MAAHCHLSKVRGFILCFLESSKTHCNGTHQDMFGCTLHRYNAMMAHDQDALQAF